MGVQDGQLELGSIFIPGTVAKNIVGNRCSTIHSVDALGGHWGIRGYHLSRFVGCSSPGWVRHPQFLSSERLREKIGPKRGEPPSKSSYRTRHRSQRN